MRKYLSLALLFLLVPALAFGATATSTGSGKWSEAIWSGGSGSGGAPADGDAVVIAEGHSVRADVDMSEWTGLTTLTITGSASGTPGMLYWADGNSSTLRFRTGTNYGILGTNVANKGRLLANSDGVWANNGTLAFATKAVIQFDGTSLLTATYLDIKLLCTEPTNKYVEVYGTAYAMADQTSGVNASTDVLTFESTPPADTTPVMLRSSGTMPGGLSTTDVYYVRDRSGNTCKLALTSGGTAVDITSTGSGSAMTMYDGHSSTSTKEMAIVQDLTADTAWITTAGHNRIVLVDVNAPADYDQQRDTIASIDTSAPYGITITANNVAAAKYPLARIWLSSRNVSVRSSSTSSSQVIVNGSTGNTFGCEIVNTYQPGEQKTFYGYGIAGNNNTISGAINGCNYGIYNSNNNTISGVISGCNYGIYGSTNNTISGAINGCYYDIQGNTIANSILMASDRPVLSFYPGTRNTSGTETRTGLETPSVEKIDDSWGDIDRATTGSGNRPNQRSGGNADVMEIYTQSGITSAQKLKLFEHLIYVPTAGSRTLTYYAQTDYSGGLTNAQVMLICDYADNATDNHRTTVQSTEGITARSDADDWDQYLSVTVVPGQTDTFVKCAGWLYKHLYEDAAVKYLWIDPKLVSSGLTISPRWYAGESLVESSATVAGGGGKWVY